MSRSSRRTAGALFCALLSPCLLPAVAASAQVAYIPPNPQIGSSNPVSAEPPVTRPSTTPCTVTLLHNQAFADFSNKPLTYTPPRFCPGPWSKVVFAAGFTVTKGRQFDRTAKFFLGGANIYFGTTAEPRATLSPSWHVERDVTELSALFRQPQTGQAILGNFVGESGGVTYNGIIYGNAILQFYPANAANPAPPVPDAVLAFPANDTARVSTTTDQSTGTFAFPRNLERLYLDVIAQSQSADEFWYTCVPNNVAGELANCGNTAFRETEVSIDGKPAGVAPVYPWIYTGGIDPYLWEPIPGIETLNLKPFRVDLTPFAGALADGAPHTVAVSVFNANSGFDVASTLLLYTDHGGQATGGALTADTLTAAPTPKVEESLNTAADGTVSGPVTVTSSRAWTISGYVNTSQGRVTTTIQASNSFGNMQDEKVSNAIFKQDLTQNSEQHETITTASAAGTNVTQRDFVYPLIVNSNEAPDNSGNYAITTYVKQGKQTQVRSPLGANSPNPVVVNEQIETTDALHYSPDFSTFLGHDNDTASSSYAAKDQNRDCYYRALAAVQNVLKSFQQSTSCSLVP